MPILSGTRKIHNDIAVNPNPNVKVDRVHAAYLAFTMPTVCVWEPVDGIGHAAVFIQAFNGVTRTLDTTGYASWFPGGDGVDQSDLLPGRMVEAYKSSFFEDCQSEAGTTNPGGKGDKFRLPEHMIRLPSANSAKMLAEWNSIRSKPGCHYRLMRKNCSTIAARVIRAGMNKKQHLGVLKKAHQPWWTPNDVLKLANAMTN